MTQLQDRIAAVLEACTTRRGFDPPRCIASWEQEAILTWRERSPLILSALEMDMLSEIENRVLGMVR